MAVQPSSVEPSAYRAGPSFDDVEAMRLSSCNLDESRVAPGSSRQRLLTPEQIADQLQVRGADPRRWMLRTFKKHGVQYLNVGGPTACLSGAGRSTHGENDVLSLRTRGKSGIYYIRGSVSLNRQTIDVKEFSTGTSDKDAASHVMAQYQMQLHNELLFGPTAKVADVTFSPEM